MARIVLCLLLLIPLTKVGLWLHTHPGTLEIHWLDTRIELSAFAVWVLLCALIAVVMVLSVLGVSLMRFPASYRLQHRLSRYENGMDHITRSLSSYAMGDSARALKELKKAARALPSSPLPHLLAAQSGEKLADDARATPHLKALLSHPTTAYIGYRRLLEQARKHPDRAEYEDTLMKARESFPLDSWLAERYVAHMLHTRQYEAAARYLGGFRLRHALEKSRRKQLARVTALAKLAAAHSTESGDYLPFTSLAGGQDMAADMVQHCASADQSGTLLKSLLGSLKSTPSLGLAQAVLQLNARADDAAREGTLRSLSRIKRPADIITRLKALLEQSTPALLALSWKCDVCGHTHAHWQAYCSHCDALASISRHETLNPRAIT